MKPMRKRIAEAGLQPHTSKRLQAALQRLAADGVRASATRWDGTRCDLLVANVDDGYGYHASQSVQRRGGAMLALSAAHASVAGARATLSPHASDDALFAALRDLLAGDGDERVEKRPPAAAHAGNLLDNLSRNDNAGMDCLLARRGPLEILIRHSASRIHASSQRDLLALRTLILDEDWSLVPVAAGVGVDKRFSAASSLDTFLIGACIAAEARLPLMPMQAYRLRQWPDMGKLGDHVDALRIVAALIREPLSAAALETRTGASAKRVNAVLWAMHAVGLLEAQPDGGEVVQAAPAVAARSRLAAVLGKLRHRFGLA